MNDRKGIFPFRPKPKVTEREIKPFGRHDGRNWFFFRPLLQPKQQILAYRGSFRPSYRKAKILPLHFAPYNVQKPSGRSLVWRCPGQDLKNCAPAAGHVPVHDSSAASRQDSNLGLSRRNSCRYALCHEFQGMKYGKLITIILYVYLAFYRCKGTE